jgi:hypothetical protein
MAMDIINQMRKSDEFRRILASMSVTKILIGTLLIYVRLYDINQRTYPCKHN